MLLSGVILTLAILSISAVSRSYMTSSMAAECGATMAGELCETLAASAVAEMEAQLRALLAKKDSPVSVELSKAVIGNQSGEIDLTPNVNTDESDALCGLDAYAECRLDADRREVRVAIQKPLDRLPYERIGVIQFRATCHAKGGGRTVSRTVEEARAFKIVLVAPPRPFDRYGLFLGELGNVTSLSAVNPARTRLIDQLGRIRTKIEAGVAAQSGDPKERLLDILDDLPTPAGAQASVKEMGESQARSMMYGLIPNFTEIDLGKLEVGKSASDAADAAEPLINGLPADGDAQLPVAGKTVAQLVSNALWSIWAFQTAFTVVPPNTPLYQQYKPFQAKIDEVYYSRRAHYRLVEAADLPDINQQLKDLMKGGPVYGIVHVQSKTQALELSGYYPGRVMFAVGSGGVKVTDVNKNETPADRLTIASFNGPLSVHGECHAHVMTGAGANLILEKGAKIVGGLTVRELVAGSRLEGAVVRLEKYFSGVAMPDGTEDDPEVFTLILSPHILYRKVGRS